MLLIRNMRVTCLLFAYYSCYMHCACYPYFDMHTTCILPLHCNMHVVLTCATHEYNIHNTGMFGVITMHVSASNMHVICIRFCIGSLLTLGTCVRGRVVVMCK